MSCWYVAWKQIMGCANTYRKVPLQKEDTHLYIYIWYSTPIPFTFILHEMQRHNYKYIIIVSG